MTVHPPSPEGQGRSASGPRAVAADEPTRVVRRRFVVRGRVQGVWFRASAAREAARLGVAGFARNERDGSVTVEAEGSAAAVGALLAWCRTGPPRATVTAVDVTELAPTGGRGFSSR